MSATGKGRPAKPSSFLARPANAVPPAQYDRMRAPVWTTTPAAPVRAGANDHKQIGSHGYRC